MSKQTHITPSDLLTNLFYVIEPEKSHSRGYDFATSIEEKALDAACEIPAATDPALRSQVLIETIINLPVMQKYRLSAEDVLIVAKCWGEYLAEGRGYFSSRKLARPLKPDSYDPAQAIAIISDLLDRKIFKFESRNDTDYHYNPVMLLEESYAFDSWFLNSLLGRDFFAIAKSRMEARLTAGDNSLPVYLDFLKVIFDSYNELSLNFINHQGYRFGRILQPVFDYLASTLDHLPADLHLNLLKSKYQLSMSDTLMVLVVYYLDQVRHDDIPVIKLLNFFATDEADFERMVCEFVDNPSHPLHTILDTEDRFLSSRRDLIVQPTASLDLTRKSASVKKAGADVKDLIANSEVLSQLKTTQTIESLILPPETKSIITAVVKKVQEPETYSLAQWGLVAQSLSADAAVLNGVCILLHGHPGTGKTFAAGAIANSLNRELININASNMKSHYYGESQKIVRSTFDEMRRICTETSNPPVFLLNEADQLIHTRSNLEGSCSSTENATQNIILEELETFPGILIATTNLIDNLDAAFSRRFHYKIELCLPDEDCRKQLWKLHLPATIPGAEDIDIAYLAKKHCISGGQIKVIVQNACSAAIIRETEQRRLSMIDIVKYAELEDGNSFEVKTKQIGFALH